MTTYIPTGDLTGLINDVAALAGQDKEVPRTHAIRIDFDGECVHTQATDDMRSGVSTWHPDDLSEEAMQEGLFSRRGGRDDPWSIVVSLPDALEVAKKFKLPDKSGWVPLGLDYIPGIGSEHRLKIARNTDTGHTGLSMVLLDRDVDFPDLRVVLGATPLPQPVAEVEFNGEALAAFGQVRQRGGGLKLAFTGADTQTLVTVGDRFRGGILPIRSKRRLASVA